MAKKIQFKVLEEGTELNGEMLEVDAIVELTVAQAKKLKGEGKIEEILTEKSEKEVCVILEDGSERVYSEAVHGEDYAKMAESLVSKKPDKRSIKK